MSLEKWWGNSVKEQLRILNKIKQLVHKLVFIRNKILTQLKETDECYNHEDFYLWYSKEDYASIWTMTNRFKYSKYIEANNLWELPKRDPSKDIYEDDQLSE